MEKRKKLIGLGVLLLLSLVLTGFGNEKYVFRENGSVVLKNGIVSMVLDERNAAVLRLGNDRAKTIVLDEPDGTAPAEIEAGKNKNTVAFKGENANTADEVSLYEENGRSGVRFFFDNLQYQYNGSKTGIQLLLDFSIAPEEDYIKMKYSVSVAENGEQLTLIRLLPEGGYSVGDSVILTAPMWGGGTDWEDPFENLSFINGVNLGFPGVNDQSLESGWVDLYKKDRSSGIGIAYINTPKTAMSFDLSAADGRLTFAPVMFEMKQILGKSVPLEPGGSFGSGDLIIAPHMGDWHRMADIYSGEFNRQMRLENGEPDYLTESEISEKIKNTDYIIRFFAGLDGKLVTTYEDMYEQVEQYLRKWNGKEPDGSHCMVWIAGQNEQGYAFDVPVMLPSYEPSGGTKGLRDLDEKLNALGCVTYHYEHPFAVDPMGQGYIASSDPFQRQEKWNLCNHSSVCIDNLPVKNLWKDKIIPDFAEVKADGIQFDQGSLQQTVCNLEGHDHGLDAKSRLTSHILAMEELSKSVHEQLPDEPFIISECSNDMTTRYVDGFSACWYRKQLYGGKHNLALRQYTFPQYVTQYGSGIYVSDGVYRESTLMGAVCGGIVTLNEGAPEEIAREYVRFRKEIRQAKAPGFPAGFRDDIGVTVSTPDLFARVFRDESGITVTYCTTGKAVEDSEITVDPELLGFTGKEKISFSVSLGENEADYKTFCLGKDGA